MTASSELGELWNLRFSGGGQFHFQDRVDGFFDLFVTGTAAQIGLQPLLDYHFFGMRMNVGQSVAVHYEAGCAVTTLKSPFFYKCFLDRCVDQAFHSGHLMTNRFHRQHKAGFYGPTIY